MKTNRLILFIFLLTSIISQAQTTTYGDSKPEEFEFLPYEGSRIIQGFRVDMGNEKFCIVYSKPDKGITPDTVFIQEYKKDGLEWKQNIKGKRSSKHTIFIWGKRGGFFTDNTKTGIAYTAFSEEDLKTGDRFIVGYFILYKNTVFTIEEDKNGHMKKSDNFDQIPLHAKERILDAFSKLDKWSK